MPRRLLIALLLLSAALAGLYVARISVTTQLLNSALASSGVKISQMAEPRIGFRGISLERLVIGSLSGREEQVLEGLRLGYSFAALRLQDLQVKRAKLQLPEPARQQEPAAPLLLSALLEQLSVAPLTSLAIDELSIEGASMPLVRQPLTLSVGLRGRALNLDIADAAGARLALALTGVPRRPTTASLTAFSDRGELLRLSATISHEALRHHLQGSALIDSEALADFLSPAFPLPPPLTHVDGKLPLTFSLNFDDDLTAPENVVGAIAIEKEAGLWFGLETGGGSPQIETRLIEPLNLQGRYARQALQEVSLEAASIAFDVTETRGSARGEVRGLSCTYDSRPLCTATVSIAGEVERLELPAEPPVELTGMAITTALDVSLDGDTLSIRWQPGPRLTTRRVAQGDTVALGAVLRAVSAGGLDYQLDTGSASLRARQLDLALPRASSADLRLAALLSFTEIALDWSPGAALAAGAHLSTDGINLQRANSWLPALAVETDIALAENRLSAAAEIASDRDIPLLRVALLHDLNSNRGSGKINSTDIAFKPRGKRLSDHFGHWPFDLDLYGGKLSLSGAFDWSQGQAFNLQGTLEAKATELAGVYGELGFIGAAASIPLKVTAPNQLVTSGDARLIVRRVDVGVPVDDISAGFRLDAAARSLYLKSFQARLFEGRIWTEDVLYLADRDYNRIDVGVDGLRVDRLLELTGYDAIQGSGVISGLLPLDVGAAGITMHRGMLAAKAPGGVFRYQTEIVPGSNAAVVQVMKALNNYHYSVFQTEADYLESGDLELSMVLRGHNPDMEQARPIHLNLNVTDNIPMLLKSLQSGRVIADRVSRKVGGSP